MENFLYPVTVSLISQHFLYKFSGLVGLFLYQPYYLVVVDFLRDRKFFYSHQEVKCICPLLESGLAVWLTFTNGTLAKVLQAEALKAPEYWVCPLAVLGTLTLQCEWAQASLLKDERPCAEETRPLPRAL